MKTQKVGFHRVGPGFDYLCEIQADRPAVETLEFARNHLEAAHRIAIDAAFAVGDHPELFGVAFLVDSAQAAVASVFEALNFESENTVSAELSAEEAVALRRFAEAHHDGNMEVAASALVAARLREIAESIVEEVTAR